MNYAYFPNINAIFDIRDGYILKITQMLLFQVVTFNCNIVLKLLETRLPEKMALYGYLNQYKAFNGLNICYATLYCYMN